MGIERHTSPVSWTTGKARAGLPNEGPHISQGGVRLSQSRANQLWIGGGEAATVEQQGLITDPQICF